MGQFFRNDLHNEFGTWPLGYTAYGGIDVGVISAVAAAVGDGDDSAFFDAWMAEGDRYAAEAETVLARGQRDSARRLYLWASACYATTYHPLYGAPVDARLVKAFRTQIAAFDKGLSLLPNPVKPLRIPYESTTLPAYFLPAIGRETERRPLVIVTNGYDATVTELYFFACVAAAQRGYHCLWFDGPGQGAPLIEQGLPLRPDWDAVVRPVVDFALTLPGIDPARIALSGLSLGGYLALRAASGEPRLAACVADPGLRSVMSPTALMRLGLTASQASNLSTVPQAVWDRVMNSSPRMHWTIVQRGFWVHGVDNMQDFVTAALAMTLEGHVGQIRCPTLLTTAENDPVSRGADALLAELQCPKTLLRFSAAEGAGDHCEMRNRSLANLRILDWLDEHV